MFLLSLVHINDLLGVDGKVFVGINDDTEEPRVCLQNAKETVKKIKIK